MKTKRAEMWRSTSEASHTATPWEVKMYGDQNKWASFRGADGFAIGDTNVSSRSPEEAIANAAFIVKAVNMHNELVTVLKIVMGQYQAFVEQANQSNDPTHKRYLKMGYGAIAKAEDSSEGAK